MGGDPQARERRSVLIHTLRFVSVDATEMDRKHGLA